jgi:hypothetical protein
VRFKTTAEVIGEAEIDIRIFCDLPENVTNLGRFGTENSVVYRTTSHGMKSEDNVVNKLIFQ